MKTFTVLAVVAFAIVATLLVAVEARNSTWGHAGPHDRILLKQQVITKPVRHHNVKARVVFPPKGHHNHFNITAIKAIDHNRWLGGHATLHHGGPRYRNATIYFTSALGHGMNYTLEIYGSNSLRKY